MDPVSEVKTCSKCGETKPVTEFHRWGNKLQGYCKVCTALTSMKWVAANRERRAASSSKWAAENPIKTWAISAIASAARRASIKGLAFAITKDWLLTHRPTHCPVLGMELDFSVGDGRQENSPSVDRIRPARGYVQGNVVVMSHRANTIKSYGTATEHRLIADWMDAQPHDTAH